jgi:hypothetical protein
MVTLKLLVDEAVEDFERVLSLAGSERLNSDIAVEILTKPHKSPTKLPNGKMAVYAFFLGDRALKIGKVGPNSAARYTSQHYNAASAASTLAGSILRHPSRVGLVEAKIENLGSWIREHTDRVNILVSVQAGSPFLSLLEAFLHFRWDPIFEGRSSLGDLR